MDYNAFDRIILDANYDGDGNFISGKYEWRGDTGFVLVKRDVMEKMLLIAGYTPKEPDNG